MAPDEKTRCHWSISDPLMVIDGSMADQGQEQRNATTRNLEVEAGRAFYDAVVQTLRSNADVVIIRENL